MNLTQNTWIYIKCDNINNLPDVYICALLGLVSTVCNLGKKL